MTKISKIGRKPLSLLMTLAMILTLLGGMTMTASAASPVTGGDTIYPVSYDSMTNLLTLGTPIINYGVTFSNSNTTAYIGNEEVTSSIISDSGTLDFMIVPDAGYVIDDVTATNGTLTDLGNGMYRLSGVTAATTITSTTTSDTNAWFNNANTAWYNPPQSSYTLTTPAQLAGLASLVNAGTDDFAGVTISLGGNIDLLGYEWTPIGGAGGMDNGVPTSNYFAGTFNGAGYTVSGLYVTRIAPGTGAYGLFGYINGGMVENLTVAGTILTAADVDSVGGVIGSLAEGFINNCHNTATVTVNNGGSSGVGGIAGTGMNSMLSECSNTADITGYSSLGGVVGALNRTSSGSASLLGCFNTGTVSCIGTSSGVSYTGGVVGYSMGHILYCYNQGDINNGQEYESGATYHRYRMGGIAGILNGGESTVAAMTGCYNTGSFTYSDPNFTPGQNAQFPNAQALWAHSDNSSYVVILSSVYLNTLSQAVDSAHDTDSTVFNIAALSSGDFSNPSVVFNYLPNGIYKIVTTYPSLWWE